MLRNTKGFTLIELMIVVVIIGILAAIAIPNFISMQDRAREGSVKANMHTVQLAMEDFAVQSDGVYATAEADATPGGDTVQDLCPNDAVPGQPLHQRRPRLRPGQLRPTATRASSRSRPLPRPSTSSTARARMELS